MLRITPDKIYEIVVKTHALAVKVDVVEPNYDSNPHGEDMQEILEEDYLMDMIDTAISRVSWQLMNILKLLKNLV